MIDFACKKIELDEVLKCSLGLTKSDLKITYYLMKNREATSSQITNHLPLNLSTVQGSLKKLYERNIVRRAQRNLSSGGYVYEYEIKDKQELKGRVMNIINQWRGNVEKELAKL